MKLHKTILTFVTFTFILAFTHAAKAETKFDVKNTVFSDTNPEEGGFEGKPTENESINAPHSLKFIDTDPDRWEIGGEVTWNGSTEEDNSITGYRIYVGYRFQTSNEREIGEVPKSATNYYSYVIPENTEVHSDYGDEILVIEAIHSSGDDSESSTKLVAGPIDLYDETIPSVQLLTWIRDYTTSIKGQTHPDTLVTIRNNEEEIGRGISDSYGYFIINIPRQLAQTILTIEANNGTKTAIKNKKVEFSEGSPFGWVQAKDKWYYYERNGGRIKSTWFQENGKWYYFDNNGVMKTGWLRENGQWYYLSNNGAMKTGWLQENGQWYYLSNSGAMETSWFQENGKWYYFDNNGVMKIGWLRENGQWYYLSNNGAMKTGWLQENGQWYYLSNSGAMKTGWDQINGTWYYFYSNGKMATKTMVDGYYIDGDGKLI